MNSVAQEKARQARNAYARAWRKKNPEKARANNERYWLRRAEREAAKGGVNNATGTTISEDQ